MRDLMSLPREILISRIYDYREPTLRRPLRQILEADAAARAEHRAVGEVGVELEGDAEEVAEEPEHLDGERRERAEAEARQRAEQKDALKRLSAENGGGAARAAKARTAKGAGRKPDARKR